MTRETYNEETKTAAMSDLFAGQSASEVAKKYKINFATVRSWKSRQSSTQSLEKLLVTEVSNIVVSQVSKFLIEYGIGDAIDQAKNKIENEKLFVLPSNPVHAVANSENRKADSGNKFLYLVQESFRGLIKIGIASNLYARFASMQTGCPQELRLIAYAELKNAEVHEAALHAKFQDKHFRGEWFELSNEDIDLIMNYHSAFVSVDYAWGDKPTEGSIYNLTKSNVREQLSFLKE